MGMSSMRCPKCGYTQLVSPTCKSCGAEIGGNQAASPPLPQAKPQPPPPTVSRPSQPRVEIPSPTLPPTQTRSPMPQRQPGSGQNHSLSFHGTGGSLFGIHIVNIFLTLITLGVYYFWGKVRVRNYLLSQSEFEGDRFAYHGTGKEMLIGFLKASLAFGGISVCFRVAPLLPGGPAVKVAAFFVGYMAILLFIPLAMVGARRYRLSRTSWRGIRFSFRGRVAEFIRLFVGGTLLTMLTLSLYRPIFDARRYGFMTSNAYFGHQKFEFNGNGRHLLGSYVLALFLTIPTLGLYWFWYAAKVHRYLWDHTTFGNARFHSTATGGGLFLLKLGNFLLLILTLGLAWPWATIRNARFDFRYLTLEGPLNMEAIQQDAQSASPTGDALDSVLGLDAGFDAAT